jgi:signal transduction histidine kinase/CheY-like chemotaxis protein
MSLPLLTVTVAREDDVVMARQRARQLARLLGFDTQDQTRLATAVSEIARNAYTYAGGGRVEFVVEGQTAPQVLLVKVSDHGRGIAQLDLVLSGQYQSPSGMGIGMLGTKRLMDAFDVRSTPQGTTVWLRKIMPRRSELITPPAVGRLAEALARESRHDTLSEMRAQNQELLRTLEELRRRQDELRRLNNELEDTNRGVLALYAELDEKADHLRRADELKSRFLSNMSHEFRTPLNSIMALSRLLLDRTDGPLTDEQALQVEFIRRATSELSELVNDLLDLTKVQAGKVVVRPVEFSVDRLFGALRGMLRPLLVNPALELVFEAAPDLPPIDSDESKISQILRNFISNALKFTERGEIRVTARVADAATIVFAVTDTGIGIAPEDQERIFEEYVQIEGRAQHRVRGTGLGLPLSRRLAELLGGRVGVESTPGLGSRFFLEVPLVYRPAAGTAAPAPALPHVEWDFDPARIPIAVVEDSPETLLMYRSYFRGTPYQPLAASSLAEARRLLGLVQPRAIILDILLRGEDAWDLLAELKRRDDTRDLPVLVVTDVDDRQKALALGANAYARKPIDRDWLLTTLRGLLAPVTGAPRILVIDDDDVARYVLKSLLRDLPCIVAEASTGTEGLEMARQQHPDVVICDVYMPGLTGPEVLRALHDDPATKGIPVIMNTVKTMTEPEREELSRLAAAVISKEVFAQPDAALAVRDALARAGVHL